MPDLNATRQQETLPTLLLVIGPGTKSVVEGEGHRPSDLGCIAMGPSGGRLIDPFIHSPVPGTVMVVNVKVRE